MKVSEETLKFVLGHIDGLIKEEEEGDEVDREFAQHLKVVRGKLGGDSGAADIISAYQAMAWDLPSFMSFVLESITNSDDANDLMSEAYFREVEWDT